MNFRRRILTEAEIADAVRWHTAGASVDWIARDILHCRRSKVSDALHALHSPKTVIGTADAPDDSVREFEVAMRSAVWRKGARRLRYLRLLAQEPTTGPLAPLRAARLEELTNPPIGA